jgi:ATP-dependent RNA helicase HelY
VRLIAEYRQIDYLPAPGDPIPIPEELVNLGEPVESATSLIGSERLDAIWEELKSRELPDLDQATAEHRRLLEERLGQERGVLDEQLAEVREQARALNQSRTQHPCHDCPRRKEHQNNLKSVADLERERGRMETDLGKELTNEEERVRRIIRGIRDVLHRFGYLHRGYPTAKADTLANVFDTNGLILCEIIDRGFLDKLSAPDAAEVFSWFAYDRDFRFGNSFTLPNRLVLLRRRLDELTHEVCGIERSNGLFISNGHSEGFYGAMQAWCHGATMSRTLEQIELSEGDLVLTFNKTIDLMRQVREMLAHAMPDHPLRETLSQAEKLVRRDIVEQSLTIGFMPVMSDETGTPAEEGLVDVGATGEG